MAALHVWPQAHAHRDGLITASARLEGEQEGELWFRFPEEAAELISARAEPWGIALLPLAMAQGADLWVHGTLDPFFLRNLEELQAIWACWYPELQRVEVRADEELESGGSGTVRAVTLFSGGVDSCHTVWRHTQGLCGRRALPLETAVMLHGSDLALERPEMFARAFARSLRLLEGFPIRLLPVATNFRAIVEKDYASRWFGSLLGASLLFFQESHQTGLIPASFSYHGLVMPYGSTPLTDPLASTKRFRIEHDGAEASRADKLRGILGWAAVQENLRVCNQPDFADVNCGKCEKCVRNILSLRVAGVREPACFPGPLTDAEIRRVYMSGTDLEAMRRLLRAAEAAGIRESWVEAVQMALRRNTRRVRWAPLLHRVDALMPRPLQRRWQTLQFQFLTR